MSYIITWTYNAVNNLERLYQFLSEKNINSAQAAINVIRERTLLLENFPNAGRPAYDLEPEHKELFVPFGESGYVILYQVKNDCIYILGIKHQKEINYKQ